MKLVEASGAFAPDHYQKSYIKEGKNKLRGAKLHTLMRKILV